MYFLTRENMNINHALQGDVECPQYRQQVFPGYRAWCNEIMATYSSNETRMELFTPVKDEAIALILAVREEAAQTSANQADESLLPEAIEYIQQLLAEKRALEAQVAQVQAQAQVAQIQAEKKALKAELAQKDAEKAEAIKALSAKLSHEKMRRLEAEKECVRLEKKAEKLEARVQSFFSIKEVQATYMRIKHNLIQKVK